MQPFDHEDRPFEIDVFPPQAEEFSLPHPRGDGEDVQGSEFVPFGRFPKLPRLIRVQGLDFLFADPGRCRRLGNVRGDQPSLHALLQRLMERGVDDLHGLGERPESCFFR